MNPSFYVYISIPDAMDSTAKSLRDAVYMGDTSVSQAVEALVTATKDDPAYATMDNIDRSAIAAADLAGDDPQLAEATQMYMQRLGEKS